MRFNNLDLNLLVTLDALLTEQSISRAAEQLCLTQPATSNALARLRDYFDDELLVLVGRAMQLTPLAESLKDAVRDILQRVDSTIASRPRFEPATADREFRLIVSDYATATWVPHLFAIATKEAPNVRFTLMPQTVQPERILDQGHADVLAMPSTLCSPAHPTELLHRETFCCVVSSESRHATRGTLTLSDYLAAKHVIMQPPGGRSIDAREMEAAGIQRQVTATAYGFSMLPDLVVGSELIATVHRRLAVRAIRMNALTILPCPVELSEMEQVVQWHKYRTRDPGLVWLRQSMHHAVRRMDGEE